MSKTTLAVVAAASAAAGASLSALLFPHDRNKQHNPPQQAPLPPTRTAAGPPQPLPGAVPTPTSLIAPVDPSGVLQYGFPGPISRYLDFAFTFFFLQPLHS